MYRVNIRLNVFVVESETKAERQLRLLRQARRRQLGTQAVESETKAERQLRLLFFGYELSSPVEQGSKVRQKPKGN